MTGRFCSRDLLKLISFMLQVAVFLVCGDWSGAHCVCAVAADSPPAAQNQNNGKSKYHTPLAGETSQVTFLGQTITIPAIDRSNLFSITLGGSYFHPAMGSTDAMPIAALYLRRYFADNSRFRGVMGFAVNELEYDKSFGFLDLVSHFENYTLPGDIREIAHNREMKATGLDFGSLAGAFGPGFRYPVSPFEVDNDLRIQLLGQVGYFYADRNWRTGPDVVVPPDTLLYGAKFRLRYDGMLRNLLELPHKGFAAGFDIDYIWRDKWRDLTPTGTGTVHNDYLQFKGYVEAVMGLPGLSEKNRVLLNVNGGTVRGADADRFNALLINGGPFPSEADDLIRPHYTGLLHDDIRAISYGTVSAGYRRELAFFLYLSLIGSYIWGERATVEGLDRVVFQERSGAAGTIALDSAFLWNSELYLGYTWESGFIRDGRSGGGVTVMWNKLF